ncbi:MAG: hypothetical protein ACK4XK_12085 [Casimicrobiaceae bacterium]
MGAVESRRKCSKSLNFQGFVRDAENLGSAPKGASGRRLARVKPQSFTFLSTACVGKFSRSN